MRKSYCLLLLLLLSRPAISKSQTLYVDPVTSAAIYAHSATINSQLEKTNNNLTLIQRGQLAVTGQLAIVNDVQSKIYSGLSEIAGAVHSLSTIKEIGDMGVDIVNNVDQAVVIAKSDPILLLFAEASAREFEDRAASLALEVSTMVIKGGKDNLMDSGERAKLLNHIAAQLQILRGNAYGMYRSMYWAKMRGIWQSLNPWGEWVNMDVQIAHDAVSSAKYLKP